MALLLIAAVKGGIAAHKDFNSPTVPEPKLDRKGMPRRRGPVGRGAYWLVTSIEKKAKGRNAAWKENAEGSDDVEDQSERDEIALFHESVVLDTTSATRPLGLSIITDEFASDEQVSGKHDNVDPESWSPHKAQLLGYDDPPDYEEATAPTAWSLSENLFKDVENPFEDV